MCEVLGYEVLTLTRLRIMNVSLRNLPVGKWRYFTPAEVKVINALVENSSKTEEASYFDD
jgi:23S rRNA pseudouridine2604 synthase